MATFAVASVLKPTNVTHVTLVPHETRTLRICTSYDGGRRGNNGSRCNNSAIRRVFSRKVKQIRRLRISARQADDMPPSEMSLESALELLGVREGATFDEILRAKNVKMDTSQGNQERMSQVDAAYDLLLMQSLSKRRAGKVVDSSVKFADVRKPRLSTPQWLQKISKSSPVAVETPPSNVLVTQAAVFGALAAWTFASGLSQGDYPTTDGSDVPGLQLALGFGASLYFLRKQQVKLGKSSLITVGGVVVGAIVGGVVESWLRVDIFPVLGISSPSVIVSEFTFLSLWLTSAYLR